MTQVSASQHQPSSKMTNSGLAFLAASIVIGTAFGGGGAIWRMRSCSQTTAHLGIAGILRHVDQLGADTHR